VLLKSDLEFQATNTEAHLLNKSLSFCVASVLSLFLGIVGMTWPHFVVLVKFDIDIKAINTGVNLLNKRSSLGGALSVTKFKKSLL
jgi:hypothetical protein